MRSNAVILYRVTIFKKHCPDRKERSENNMSRSFYGILNEITDASSNHKLSILSIELGNVVQVSF